MVWKRNLLAVAVVGALALSLSLTSASAAFAEECTRVDLETTGCPTVGGSIDDGQVTLGGSETTPGNPGAPGSPGAPATGSGGGQGQSVPPTSPPCQRVGPKCVAPRKHHDDPATPPAGSPPVGSRPPVTIRDLAAFRPAPGTDHMEPNGWMIVGLDTNFFAQVGVQVQDGQLLGRAASVRFTPVRYHWTYGDGAASILSTKGATWAAQGITEFDPTPTSHIYRREGTYYIDLTIDFSAEYRYAGGAWTRISGTIAVPANRLVATAGGAKTVLVQRECTINPAGPGC